MTKYKESIFLRVNKFVESRLRGISELNGSSNSLMQIIPLASAYTTDVDTNDQFEDSTTTISLPFMLPAGELPEVMTPYQVGDRVTEIFKKLPICTYTFSDKSTSDQPWMRCSQITYVFYHIDVALLIEIVNMVIDLCKREDWSASDINYFYRNDNTNPFDFKEISVLSASGPMPANEDGGRYSYLVTIYCDATYEGINRAQNYSAGNQKDLGMI